MSFIRKKVSAYPWPVEIRKPSEEVVGEFETQKFTIRFKRLAKKELNDFQEKEDYDALKSIIVGWSDIKDEDDKLSLIHIRRCRRSTHSRSRWSPYH